MLLERLFQKVEIDFLNYRLRLNLFFPNPDLHFNNATLDTGLRIDIFEFVRSFEKTIFLNVPLEKLTPEGLITLKHYRAIYEEKLKELDKLIYILPVDIITI